MDRAKGYRLERYGLDISPELIGVARQRLTKILRIFDANNPGVWAFHCHILYHLAAGMFTVLKYDGVNTEFWQPDKTLGELATPGPTR